MVRRLGVSIIDRLLVPSSGPYVLRPVWVRAVHARNVVAFGWPALLAPDEAEVDDAIAVLADLGNQVSPPLWNEALAILDEISSSS